MSVLAPGILIAAPPLDDPHFDRSVVLLASHDEEGAFGWVINGSEVMSLEELLVRAGISDEPRELPGVVRRGGPVSEEQVWLVYPEGSRLVGVEGQIQVAPGLMATASRTFLEELAGGRAVPGLLAIAGYAGWGPGQLEREIQRGSWLPGPADVDLVLETPAADAWFRAYERVGTSPFAFATRTVGLA
ncbi:MAG TPA: YqgE/AlgH family protein [Polyangiaceae bacterium]|nr:YqgE/AlgH family protein [Polyangiaceae bacterium]